MAPLYWRKKWGESRVSESRERPTFPCIMLVPQVVILYSVWLYHYYSGESDK